MGSCISSPRENYYNRRDLLALTDPKTGTFTIRNAHRDDSPEQSLHSPSEHSSRRLLEMSRDRSSSHTSSERSPYPSRDRVSSLPRAYSSVQLETQHHSALRRHPQANCFIPLTASGADESLNLGRTALRLDTRQDAWWKSGKPVMHE